MTGIRNFVRNLKVAKDSSLKQVNHYFVGNEAADADSIVSALCCGYYYESTGGKAQFSALANHVPVVSINRNEIHLRRDVKVLLDKISVELSDLLCINDILSDSSHEVINVTLLDHNALSNITLNSLRPFDDLQRQRNVVVHEILDHHKDLGQHSECQGEMRQIAFDSVHSTALVGSACTLIFEKYFPSNFVIEDDVNRSQIEPEVATLLMGVIALDTLNMSPQAGKGTPRDARALEILQQYAKPIIPDLTTFFNELSGAKTDPIFWNELSASDCLLLDFKLVEVHNQHVNKTFNIGMSSIAQSVSDFVHKEHVVSSCREYLHNNKNRGGAKCDVLIIMGASMQPEFHRDLLIVTHDISRMIEITGYLSLQESLQLTPLPVTIPTIGCSTSLGSNDEVTNEAVGLYFEAFSQGNAKASRKQVAPIISTYFEQIKDCIIKG